MNDTDPPPETKLPDPSGKAKLQQVLLGNKAESDLRLRKARISDVEEILELVNGYAALDLMLPRGPQYLYENIRDFIVVVDDNDTSSARGGTPANRPMIAACGSLHVLWKDIAEIRSMAIHADYQNMGLGKKIVDHMKQEAGHLGIRILFTFTLADEFFKKLGFKRKDKTELPPKVWGECSRCPKYFKCDEVGMVLEL